MFSSILRHVARTVMAGALLVSIAIPVMAAMLVANFHPTGLGLVPAGLTWKTDAESGIHLTDWVEQKDLVFANGMTVGYGVAAVSSKGLERIELFVNGELIKTCRFDGSYDIQGCRIELKADAYNVGTLVFANANIIAKGANAWVEGTIFTRPVTAISESQATPTSQPVATEPLFRITTAITPNRNDIARGETITYAATAQQNTLGLNRTELYVNGTLRRTCRYGAVVSAVTCSDAVVTSAYPEGTAVSLLALAIDNDGRELWSDARTIAIRTQTQQAPFINGATIWSAITPNVAEIVDEQVVPFTVGAWSTHGIKSIDIIVDGRTIKTCLYAAMEGNKECVLELRAKDYFHGHVLAVNARVTDGENIIHWTEPRTLAVKRIWNPLPTTNPYTTIATDRGTEYAMNERITFTYRGWTSVGVDRLELYVNGVKASQCPNDVCTWTSAPVTDKNVEYAVRMLDRVGHETWSGLYGLRRN